MNDTRHTDHPGDDTPTGAPRDGFTELLEFIRNAVPIVVSADSDFDEMGMTKTDHVNLDVDRDGLTGELQLAVVHWPKGEGYGDGHRLHGPKYSGHSAPVISCRLTREDADEIRTRLDKVHPADVEVPGDAELGEHISKLTRDNIDLVERLRKTATKLLATRKAKQENDERWQLRIAELEQQLRDRDNHVCPDELYEIGEEITSTFVLGQALREAEASVRLDREGDGQTHSFEHLVLDTDDKRSEEKSDEDRPAREA